MGRVNVHDLHATWAFCAWDMVWTEVQHCLRECNEQNAIYKHEGTLTLISNFWWPWILMCNTHNLWTIKHCNITAITYHPPSVSLFQISTTSHLLFYCFKFPPPSTPRLEVLIVYVCARAREREFGKPEIVMGAKALQAAMQLHLVSDQMWSFMERERERIW